ncbi:MAG: mechanosensitive ion channel domain-containing protein [Planctomycetota bacterium]
MTNSAWAGDESPPAEQEAPAEQDAQSISMELIEQTREQLELATDIEEATLQELQSQCDEAARFLEAAEASESQMAELQSRIESATKDMADTQAQLEEIQKTTLQKPSEEDGLETLQEQLLEKEGELDEAKSRLANLESELLGRVAQRRQLPEKINSFKNQLEEIDQKLSSLDAEEAGVFKAQVQRILLLAKRRATQRAIEASEKELEAYAATRELLPMQQRLVAEQIAKAQAEVDNWRRLVNLRMEREAKTQTEQARKEVAQTVPGLQPLAEQNQELAEATQEATASFITESVRLKSVTETLEDVSNGLKRTRKRGTGKVGFSEAMGLLLRSRRASLPETEPHRRTIQMRQSQLRDVQSKLFEFEDRRAEMANFDQYVKQKTAEVRQRAGDLSLYELQRLPSAVRDVLAKQRDQLDTAINKYFDLLGLLVEMDEKQRELVETLEEYKDYIDERVLWIRSDSPLEQKDVLLALETLGKTLNPDGPLAWSEMLATLKTDFIRRSMLWGVAGVLLILWLYEQPRFRRVLTAWGEAAEQSNLSRITPTLTALLVTLVLAGFWPLLLRFLAWRLQAPTEPAELSGGIASGLTVAAWCLFPGLLLHQLCRPKGLGQSHFRWAPGALRLVRKHLYWLIPTFLPLAFVVGTLEGTGLQQWTTSAGRISFIIACVLIGAFAHLMLRPGGAFFRQLLAAKYNGVFYRFRHLWWGLALVLVSTLIVLALRGYNYTAQQLAARLGYTLLFLLVLLVGYAFLTRWILVARRQLAMEQLRQRRSAPEKTPVSPDGAWLAVKAGTSDNELDLSASSAQTQRLLRSFFYLFAAIIIYWTWIDMLPALSILNKIPAVPGAMQVVEDATGDEATDAIAIVPHVSIGDLALAFLTLLMTVIAARNIPGLLDISIPKRFPLDSGARYAITTLSRYLIVIAGIVIGANFLGIAWSNIQWLVAAVSVGLGFGLQEIFANFVSGVIILFERPIRIGDIVTVDDISGIVSRIQTRATTVTNWDRQEFIVPNKEFITGRLLNWTHHDKLNRAVITVGVAYGSDVALVTDLLHKVARAHPNVLEEPAPLITFDEFGDSSLNFTVRVYLPDFEKRLVTIHELNQAIDRAFREAGVEIPYPQRDVHFRGGWPDVHQILPPGSNAEHTTETNASRTSGASGDSVDPGPDERDVKSE